MKKSILLFTFIFLTVSSLAVFAQSGAQQGGSPDTVISTQQGANSQKCIDVTRKVDLVTERYNENQEKYMNAFENVFKNVEALALKFKADGYDTAQLEQHLEEYNNMVQNASRYYNEFKVGMDNSKKGVCGNSDADAGQEFNTARTQLMECKNEMLQLRTFAQETLKQDLLDLKSQVVE
ncbi:MAG: hypothetical protein UR34_C0011G0029 [candidate division WS6 bacterium GW2011_GWC1_33_20]|uniref:Uncharacterized protein n=1 Tax=candidate division WS6 bacterium GW2011_GWC1_33_20 TaxID=1619089 RepID=A0A0G0BY31_9BACT|nr:MAG: hypothetical protein UR34_C0011G0029 [candidate division WS6 bacterium GW2011_GWC1_33_20]OGC36258.1 MAG: hypothetical protein A2369_03045 [candidate division WS6 bacterium RIFOXYB1_FULL_33_15]OGC38178.1 MAG: hypothetical protein A2436_01405 [candidate division WS6 bacterium RIFOXYC1_FULL_33_9]HBB64362.1 hypothetical protein [Patescibacteria group bacterium]